MTDWRDLLDRLSQGDRIKAHLAFELASDRASGEPVEVAAATLRAVARAEGLDTGRPWIAAAALDIACGRIDPPPRAERHADRDDVSDRAPESTGGLLPPGGATEDTLEGIP